MTTRLPKHAQEALTSALDRLTDSVTVSAATRQTFSKLKNTPVVMRASARTGLGSIVLMSDQDEFGWEAQLELLGDLGFQPAPPATALERATASIGAS